MLYYKATAGCGLEWAGSSARVRAAPSHSSWVAQRRRCAFRPPDLRSRRPHHAHRSHPYPLLRRPTASFLVLYVPYALPFLLPWPPARRCHVVSALFAVPSPRPSFIPCLHTPSFWYGTWGLSRFRDQLRRPSVFNGCLAACCFLAVIVAVIFLAAAWRALLTFLLACTVSMPHALM